MPTKQLKQVIDVIAEPLMPTKQLKQVIDVIVNS